MASGRSPMLLALGSREIRRGALSRHTAHPLTRPATLLQTPQCVCVTWRCCRDANELLVSKLSRARVGDAPELWDVVTPGRSRWGCRVALTATVMACNPLLLSSVAEN